MEFVLRPASLRSTGAACSQGRLLPRAARGPIRCVCLRPKSDPVNSSSAASSAAAAFSLAPFQSIPACFQHRIGTRAPVHLTAPSHRSIIGRTIYCDAADYGPVRGGSKTARCTGPNVMVGADGDRLEGGQGKGGSNRRSGGASIDGLGLGVRGRHTGWDRERHGGGGIHGSKRLQWSGVEWGGGLTPAGGDLKQVQCSGF